MENDIKGALKDLPFNLKWLNKIEVGDGDIMFYLVLIIKTLGYSVKTIVIFDLLSTEASNH